MASIFTYQDEPPRIQSPWSTPGSNTPRGDCGVVVVKDAAMSTQTLKLEPERQDGPTEYKLHLLLRPRRKFITISTTEVVPGSFHSRPAPIAPGSRSSSDCLLHRATSLPSNQTRQTRLQQLTTQLLWRLQQSSPFHSSSNTELVLPVLPEATPRLGVPDGPAKLLSGLEESQGALYEIGVADDGTLVGLVDDELDESLTNLCAMAASLGCVIDVLRKVAVGFCRWADTDNPAEASLAQAGRLWVAEVLVRPDSQVSLSTYRSLQTEVSTMAKGVRLSYTQPTEGAQSRTQQFRVTLLGSTMSGKSSLLGTLSTSVLDNGRGKSRLSLLKHRHEIASGITSSVAHELVGYAVQTDGDVGVVNYAVDDVSAWTDVHNLATRLTFLSDSPGSPRFAKSTLRALMSWAPHWAIFCIAANDAYGGITALEPDKRPAETDSSLLHLHLCLKLRIPLIVVVTKMDQATKAGLRAVLGKLLSALKQADRKPLILSSMQTPSTSGANPCDHGSNLQNIQAGLTQDIKQMNTSLKEDGLLSVVPVVMTSAVNGAGINNLHALLCSLPYGQQFTPSRYPCPKPTNLRASSSSLFHIDEVFSIPPSKVYKNPGLRSCTPLGVVFCGHLDRGLVTIGDELHIGPFVLDGGDILPRDCGTSPGSKSTSRTIRHSSKAGSRSLTPPLSLSESVTTDAPGHSKAASVVVRVVSIRNLRLPVRELRAGETGTIGVEPTGPTEISMQLHKARKGMVLTNAVDELSACRGLTVVFNAADFPLTSSPLSLGGHTTLYVNSVRATAKVTGMVLDETDSNKPARTVNSKTSPTDLFSFDEDDDNDNNIDGNDPLSDEDDANDEDNSTSSSSIESSADVKVKISFRFVRTVEWLEVGDRVLVIPNTSSSSSSNNNNNIATTITSTSSDGNVSSANNPTVSKSLGSTPPVSTYGGAGFSGFVGIVCDLLLL